MGIWLDNTGRLIDTFQLARALRLDSLISTSQAGPEDENLFHARSIEAIRRGTQT